MPTRTATPRGGIERAARALYVRSLVAAYHELPDATCRARADDRRLAAELFDRQVPLQLAKDALLLATARRLIAAQNGQPHPAVRSLRYYRGAIDELLDAPIADDYRRYLLRLVGTIRKRAISPSSAQQQLPFEE